MEYPASSSILPTWANMATKLKKGASSSVQHFSEEKLTKWREELQRVAKGVAIYMIDVVLLGRFL